MELENKVALVTGSSSGIGAAIAERFAREGADIVVCCRKNTAGAEKVVELVRSLGRRAHVVCADVSEEEGAKKVVDECVGAFGRIDILVNNAGGYIHGDEWNGSAKVWEDTFKQNVITTMLASKYAYEVFKVQQSGVMVNITSKFAMEGRPYETAYSAAKAGVINTTQMYAKLLAPFGRANCVTPGLVYTGYWLTAPEKELARTLESTPLKKPAQVSDVAEAVLFLASDRSSVMTGHNLVLDGGYLMK